MAKPEQQPSLRESIELFQNHINAADVHAALSAVLLEPEGKQRDPVRESRYDYGLQTLLFGGSFENLFSNEALLDYPSAIAATKPFDLPNFLKALADINHPNVWEYLLEQSIGRNKEVETQMKSAFGEKIFEFFSQSGRQVPPTIETALKGDNPHDVRAFLAEDLASRNMKLLGKTVIMFGLAAMVGRSYPRIFVDQSENRYKAGLLASKLFDQPAQNSTEVVDRLQQLFPATHQSINDIPAIRFVKEANAFINIQPDGTVNKSAGTQFTGLLFSEYGKILARPAYQNRLKACMAKR